MASAIGRCVASVDGVLLSVITPAEAEGVSAERKGMIDESSLHALEQGGPLDEINQIYYSRGWTDGLPIIPLTEGRVQAMLAVVERDPEEVIAAIPPKWGRLRCANWRSMQ